MAEGDSGSTGGGGNLTPQGLLSAETAEGMQLLPGTVLNANPGQDYFVPTPTWDTQAFGQWGNTGGTGAAGSAPPNVSWIPGSEPFSVDPRFAGNETVSNDLLWPGTGGHVPVLGTGAGGRATIGGANNVITDVSDLQNAPYWTETAPGVYAPTQEGMSYGKSFDALQSSGLNFFLMPLMAEAGMIAGPLLGGAAASLLGSAPSLAGTDLTTAALSGQLGAGVTGGLGSITSGAPSLLGSVYGAYQAASPYISGVQNAMKIANIVQSATAKPPQQSASLLR